MAPTCSTENGRLGDFRGWYDSVFCPIFRGWSKALYYGIQPLTITDGYKATLSITVGLWIHHTPLRAAWMSRGSDARVRELMIIAKQVKTSNPFCFSSILRFSNKPKMALFAFYGQDPSKMGVLAPSRKPVRIGLYREGRKGPKSTFFGWSGFWPKWPFFGFFEVFMKMMIFDKISTHLQS